MGNIIEIIEKIENTSKDDLDLRCEIATKLGWTCELVGRSFGWHPPHVSDHVLALPPRWLTSLDAAMSLVPSGWYVEKLTECDDHGQCSVKLKHAFDHHHESNGCGFDVAHALCAAALRAQGLS